MASIENKLSSLKEKIAKSNDLLYSDVYYNDNVVSQQIKDLKDKVNAAINKITNNNMSNTGESNMSILYQKTYGIKPSGNNSAYDLLTQVNQTLSDRNSMNNVLAVYTQNTMVRDIDREIDMVCKYMPKLDDALETRREHVLSADRFSKNSLVIKSANDSSLNAAVINNIETMKEKYNLEDFLDNKVYRPTDKYGETFVYIIPYKRAIETLMNSRYGIDGNLLSSQNEDVHSIIESAINETIDNYSEEIGIKKIIQEAVSEFDDLSKKAEIKQSKIDAMNAVINEACNVTIEINKSRVLRSAILDRFKTLQVFKENASLFFNEKANDISGSIVASSNKYQNATNDTNTSSSSGVSLSGADGLFQPSTASNKIKIPGCVVKTLDHTMVKPLYIDNICLGYFYIECDKQMALEQTTYSSTLGGVRPGGVYSKTNPDQFNNTSNELSVIKNIADSISNKIDAKFVNANQDLSKEIYSILKYNASVDASGKVAKITITFIPPEDIEHCYFEFDENTKRGVSGLLRSLFPAKLFSCLYISNVIQSITRGFDKRVYYVRQTVDTNIAGTLMNVINQIQRSNFGIRQVESMSNVLNMIGKFNDIVIPRSASGDAPVDFEVMPGQQTEIKTELMNMLEEMAVNATDVPFEELQSRQQTDYATRLTMRHSSFLQKIYNRQGKVQRFFSRIVSKIYNYEYNMDTGVIDEIEVQLPPPVYLNAVNSAQVVDQIAALAQSVASAYVNEQENAELLTELKRQVQISMIGSLFPQNFIEKNMSAAKIELAKSDGTSGGDDSSY